MTPQNYSLYKNLIDNIPGIVFQFYVKSDGRKGFHYASPKIAGLLEIENYTMENLFDKFAERLVPEYKDAFMDSVNSAIKDFHEWKFDCCLLKSSGEQIWFNGIADPQKSGNEIIFNGILFDITERKKLEIEQQKRIEQQKKSSRILWEFVNNRGFFLKSLNENLDDIIVIASQIMNAERVSVWLYNEDMSQMKCNSLFHKGKLSSENEEILLSSEFPEYTSSHKTGDVIAVENVFSDYRTAKISFDYFKRNDIYSLIDAPIWVKGHLFGVLSFEYCGKKREFFQEDKQLALTFASCITYCFETDENKRAEIALEKRIIAMTKPLQKSGPIELDDLFNIKEIQKLQDLFAEATGVASVITAMSMAFL